MPVPRPSGRAERQVTHPLTSGPDGCEQAVHEGARDSLSLVCRGGHTTEHPGCACRVGRGRDSKETAA